MQYSMHYSQALRCALVGTMMMCPVDRGSIFTDSPMDTQEGLRTLCVGGVSIDSRAV